MIPELDPRLRERLERESPARTWLLDTWRTVDGNRAHAGYHLRQAGQDARKLRSRERRALFDVLYALIRHHAALTALGAVSADEQLDLLLTTPELTHLPLAVRLGVPEWVADDLTTTYGDELEAWVAASGDRAPTTLRVNLSRIDRARLQARLAEADIVTEAVGRAGLNVEGRANLLGHPAFQDGFFEIQDLGSQLVADAVEGKGLRVLDLCAGAGGKSLALADAGALVHATDVRSHALDELRKRAKRSQLKIRTVARDQLTTYDRVLVDAPCSGSGVWRRTPATRWRLAEPLETALQGQLLDEAATRVGPGGRVVYATCSALRAENEAVVDAFLARHPSFDRVRPDLRLSPHRDGTDGMYAAVLHVPA